MDSNPRSGASPSLAIGFASCRRASYAGDCASAVEAASRAQSLLWMSPTHFEAAEYHFYGALVPSGASAIPAPAERAAGSTGGAGGASQAARRSGRRIALENFENRAALVGAEIARLEGRELDAERLYEQAIRSARGNGFIHNEALAYELAARFYAARGFDAIAHSYLRNARYGYLRWGADRQGAAARRDCIRISATDQFLHSSQRARSGRPSSSSTSRR